MILIAGCAVPLLVNRQNGNDMTVMLATVAFIALVLSIAVLNGVRKSRACVRKLWETFELEVDATHITRRNADTPTATIAFADVTEIIRYPGRGMLMKTSRALQTVEVPEWVENYEQAVEMIRQHCSVQIKTQTERTWHSPIFLVALGLSAWVLFLNIQSKMVTLIVGAALVGLCGWSIWAVNRSPNVSQARKRSLVYAFLIVICLAKMGYAAGLLK